jgi:hypothetical protein
MSRSPRHIVNRALRAALVHHRRRQHQHGSDRDPPQQADPPHHDAAQDGEDLQDDENEQEQHAEGEQARRVLRADGRAVEEWHYVRRGVCLGGGECAAERAEVWVAGVVDAVGVNGVVWGEGLDILREWLGRRDGPWSMSMVGEEEDDDGGRLEGFIK